MIERKYPQTRLRRTRMKDFLRDLVAENNLTTNDLISSVEDSNVQIKTVYWHLLDHGKLSGKWQPPIPQSILNH